MRKLAALALLLAACGGSGPDELNSPPTAPFDVNAAVTAQVVSLTWTAPDKGAPIQRYAVLMSTDGVAFSSANATFSGEAAQVSGLLPGSYWFEVIARNAHGDSPPSEPFGPVVVQ